MVEPLKSGDGLRRISARRLERAMVAGDVFAEQRKTGGSSSFGGRSPWVVLARNDTGEDVPRFGVVSLDSVIFNHDDNAEGFNDKFILIAKKPLAYNAGRIGISSGPIARKKLGLVRVGGVFAAKVNVEKTSHRFAVLTDNSVSVLKSNDGAAGIQILFSPDKTGEQMCIIRMGVASGNLITAMTDANGISAGTSSAPGTGTVTLEYIDASGNYANQVDEDGGSVTTTVLNVTAATINPSKRVQITSDEAGNLWVVVEDCG